MFLRWKSIVRGLRNICAATSLFERPWATKPGDAELLRRQPCRCFRLGGPGVLAARAEFGPRTLRPLAGAERVEGLERRAQVLAGIDPAPVPAQELAVDE